MKIVVLDGYTENPGDLSWKDLEALGETTIYDRTPVELVEERIGDAEIVITNKTPIDKEIFEKCQNIKYVGVLATGYNVVDVNTAAEKEFRYAIFLLTEQQQWRRWYLHFYWKSAIM